jgi:hypothetical protein
MADGSALSDTLDLFLPSTPLTDRRGFYTVPSEFRLIPSILSAGRPLCAIPASLLQEQGMAGSESDEMLSFGDLTVAHVGQDIAGRLCATMDNGSFENGCKPLPCFKASESTNGATKVVRSAFVRVGTVCRNGPQR